MAGKGYWTDKTELQIHIHDSSNHPFKVFSSTISTENLTFKVAAVSVKEPSTEIEFQLKDLSQKSFHVEVQDVDGRIFREGNFLTFSCQVTDLSEIVIKIQVLGIGIAVIPCSLLKNHHQKLCLPVCDKNICKGTIEFDCLIITPWANKCMQHMSQSDVSHWHPSSIDRNRCLEMGHRGCGSTHGKTRSASTPIENTVASFTKAFEKGADYVELDVQLTKDLIPVVFHDFFVASFLKQRNTNMVRKIKMAVNDLTFEELSTLEFTFTGEPNLVKVDAVNENTEDCEAGLFPSLEQVLKRVPMDLGIFIELKFPMQEKSGTWESDRHVDKNELVERTLDVVYSNAEKRRILFGSFDPSVCTMMRLKQPWYSVVLITSGENHIYPMCMDHRCRTVKMAQHFALSENLLGISAMSDPLIEHLPAVLEEARNNGLELFTWGDANVNGEYIDKQKKLGITGIIYDRLHELKSA